MIYEESLQFIHSLDKFGSRPGLERVGKLFGMVPEVLDQRFIHVAGTNGKGSVCALLSAVLAQAGYKTGLFISPYITDFRERMQINNHMIPKEELAKAVEFFKPKLEKLNAEGVIITEFEFVTVLSFYLFKQQKCDVVVCETGMGGLLDSTNLIPCPLCSVITRIDLDHTAVLGNTIAEIAEQKCGIIKENSFAVTSAQSGEAMLTIENSAREKGVDLLKSETMQFTVMSEDLHGTAFIWNDIPLKIPLAGHYQLENAKAALAALDALRQRGELTISDSDIQKGFAAAVNPARLEVLGEDPIVLLDGAHNPNGLAGLRMAIQKHLGGKKIFCVIGMMADKDIESATRILTGVFSEIYTVPVNNPRAIDPEELARIMSLIPPYIAIVAESPREAFDTAYERARQENGAVLVCGSLYLAGEIRPYIIEKLKDSAGK